MGRPAVVESRPWATAVPAAPGPTAVLDISLPRGVEVRQTGHRSASCLDVDVPALLVTTTAAATMAVAAPEQLRVVDLAGLRVAVRAFPAGCHWRPVPGLDSVLMGVAETSRDVAVGIQRLDLGTCRAQLVDCMIRQMECNPNHATMYTHHVHTQCTHTQIQTQAWSRSCSHGSATSSRRRCRRIA